jgi:hypothetical protein
MRQVHHVYDRIEIIRIRFIFNKVLKHFQIMIVPIACHVMSIDDVVLFEVEMSHGLFYIIEKETLVRCVCTPRTE